MIHCTFFGHRDTPGFVKPVLMTVLRELIEKKNVRQFFVGNQGAYDVMVKKCLRELKKEYPHIGYAIVLAYLPKKKLIDIEEEETLFPEELEGIPPWAAIGERNYWMVEHSEYVVTYVTRFGSSRDFKDLAVTEGKTVIELSRLCHAEQPEEDDI